MNYYDLKGKVALVTGAGQGIGKAAAEAIVRSGGDVVLCDINEEKIKQNAAEFETLGVKAVAIKMDVSDIESINAGVDEAVAKLGHIDILLNCAGIQKSIFLVDMTPEEWDRHMNINLRGGVFLTKAVAKHMLENGIHGTIEFISSQAGKIGEAENSAYSTSKSAMFALVQSLALEFAENDINVVAIAPGFTNSDMMQNMFKREAELNNKDVAFYEKQWSDKVPMKRMAEPYEIGSFMAFLASKEAHYITGVTISIAGGNILV